MLSRSEDCALLLGRVFVAALFLPSGLNKLMAFSAFAASLRAKGLPYPEVIAGIMVAAEFIGPLALLIGLWPRWTALVLICFTGVSLWMAYGQSGVSMLLRPQQAGSYSSTSRSWADCCFISPVDQENPAEQVFDDARSALGKG